MYKQFSLSVNWFSDFLAVSRLRQQAPRGAAGHVVQGALQGGGVGQGQVARWVRISYVAYRIMWHLFMSIIIREALSLYSKFREAVAWWWLGNPRPLTNVSVYRIELRLSAQQWPASQLGLLRLFHVLMLTQSTISLGIASLKFLPDRDFSSIKTIKSNRVLGG